MYLQGATLPSTPGRCPPGANELAGAVAKRLPEFKGKHFLVRGAMEPLSAVHAGQLCVHPTPKNQKYLKKPITSKAAGGVQQALFRRGCPSLDEPTQLQYGTCTPG